MAPPGAEELAELQAIFSSLVDLFDGEEAVDEYSHALQCAALAERAGEDDEVVVAALLHDVARSPLVKGADLAHEIAGARWCAARLTERIAWLVRAHVPAKLYLLETDPSYRAHLSSASLISAAHQSASGLAVLAAHEWWPDALRLRRYDDGAKVPGLRLVALEPELERVLRFWRA
jgi:predicted HD phosphohydrolase